MKKISTIVIFLLVNTIYSQNLSKDELIKALTKSSCDCINEKEITPDKLELPLGLCLLKAVNENKPDVEKHFGKNYYSKMEEIGELIGEDMALNCPKFAELILTEEVLEKYSDYDGFDEENQTEDNEIVSENLKIEAKFVITKEDGFLYVTFKEDKGKSHQMILINNFENAYLITDKVLKANDKVEIYYFEAELYDAKYKKFINCKVIDDIIKL